MYHYFNGDEIRVDSRLGDDCIYGIYQNQTATGGAVSRPKIKLHGCERDMSECAHFRVLSWQAGRLVVVYLSRV